MSTESIETKGPLSHKTVTVSQMISNVRATIASRQAKFGDDTYWPTGPLFSFLVGAGFSRSAGVPTSSHLVAALEEYKKGEEKDWQNIFDKTKEDEGTPFNCDITQRYFELMREVFHLPPGRHDFITAAIQWAARQKIQANIESILLASMLIAGTGAKLQAIKERGVSDKKLLCRAFARHVFTTNFDEVLPCTFYYGNQSVDIFDGPGDRTISAAAEYPTVIYLHGRHLHYDIRNTPEELKFRQRSKSRDLFEQFRDILKTTGLIVIGYSGAEDLVMESIKEALDDPSSLPYGLWWTAYEDEKAIHKDARSLIEQYDKAYLLDPGKKADEIMKEICNLTGIDSNSAIVMWMKEAERLGNEVQKFRDEFSYDIRKLQDDALRAGRSDDKTDREDMVKKWEEIERTVIKDPDSGQVANLLNPIGRVYLLVGLTVKALKAFTKALELHRKVGDDLGAANDLHGLGDVYLRMAKIGDSEKAYGEALVLHRKVRSDLGVANDLKGLGDIFLRMGRIDDSEKSYREAFELHHKAGDNIGAANDLMGLGDVHLRMSRIDDSERSYRESLELHRKVGDDLGAANALNGLGYVHLRRGRIDDSEKAYREALELHRKVGADLGAANDLSGLGYVHLRMGMIDDSEKSYSEALELHRKVGDDLGAAYDLMGLAGLKFSQGNYEDPSVLLDDSENYFKKAPDVEGELELKLLRGRLAVKQGDKDKAREIIESVRDEAEKLGFMLIKEDAEKYLVELDSE